MNPQPQSISRTDIISAINRACIAIQSSSEHLTSLDQAMGDGDLGITAAKISASLSRFAQETTETDLGKLLIAAGMATNRAAPSTMGTLIATALMRVGREISGKEILENKDLVQLLIVAGNAFKERGKANIGDKTALDVIVPAGEAFKEAIDSGMTLKEAALKMVDAAKNGRDQMTPKMNRIGRASWLGERTIGLVDPGCELMVVILTAL